MLNPFPDLLNYSLLAPFILRVVLGLILLDVGILKFRGEKKRWLAVFESLRLRPTRTLVPVYGALQILGGILLLIGLWTQVAALAFAVFTFCELYIEWTEGNVLKRDFSFYLLVFVIAVSLLFTGAGAFALDIQL